MFDTNKILHIDAIEYAEGFSFGLENNGEGLEEKIANWHKKFSGPDATINPEPTSYQLAALRGLESAGIWLQGPKAFGEFNGIVVLDQSGR